MATKKKSKKSLSFLTKKAAAQPKSKLTPIAADMVNAAREFIERVGPARIPRLDLLKKSLNRVEREGKFITSIDIELSDGRVISIERRIVDVSVTEEIQNVQRLIVSTRDVMSLPSQDIVTNRRPPHCDRCVFSAISSLHENYNGRSYALFTP